MPVAIIERPEYRALHHHEDVAQVLRDGDLAGKLHLALYAMTPPLSRKFVQTYIVSPKSPTFDIEELDLFRNSILSDSCIKPDWQTCLLAEYTEDGLPVPEMNFYNVPGLIHFCGPCVHRDEIILDIMTRGTSKKDLEKLAEVTGKPAVELVRITRVLIYPEANLAEFMADLIWGLQEKRYASFVPLCTLQRLISVEQVGLLQKNPETFFRLLKEMKRQAKLQADINRLEAAR